MSSDSTKADDLGIIYRRVSDDKQSGAGSQLANLRHLARVNGVKIEAEVEDDGESGDDLDRPGLTDTLARLEKAHRQKRPITWLLVDHSDRLSRADSLDTFEVLAKMRRWGVKKVATPARVYDLYNRLDRTLLEIEIDHKNNPHLKDMSRLVLGGMLDAARLGFWTGQVPPLGYKVVKRKGDHPAGRRRTSGRLEIDPETAPVVLELFERYRDGESARDLARWLTARLGRRRTYQGVYKILRREIYTGTRTFGENTSGKHARLKDGQPTILLGDEEAPKGDVIRLTGWPVIIEPDLFADVQRRRALGKSAARKKSARLTPLSGLCKCGACGAAMHCQRQPPSYVYIRCSRHEEDKALCPTSVHARGDVVLARVCDVLERKLLQGDGVARLIEAAGKAEDEARAEWGRKVASAQRALDACGTRLATARRRLVDAVDDMREEYELAIRELKEEQAAATADLVRVRGEQPVAEEGDAALLERWLQTCRSACTLAAGPEIDEPALNAVMREVVAFVRITPPEQPKRGNTVGKVEVVLPEWLSRILSPMAGCSEHFSKSIVLTSEVA